MDTFFAIPSSTTYTPLSPSAVIVEDIITPILPNTPYYNLYPTFANRYINPNNSLYYYDSGIGENPIVQNTINSDLRYKFLDKWLHEDYQEILRYLKVENSHVKVLSKAEMEQNDISKDTQDDYNKKSDFIGFEILTLSKNKKILDSIVNKNNLKYYDLPHNSHFVKKEQAKYVTKKIKHMQQ